MISKSEIKRALHQRTKVIVTGGRDFMDYYAVKKVLDSFPHLNNVIQGGAKGADACARAYCELHEVVCVTYDADWNAHGKSAGPRRNALMLRDHPTAIVVAFPGGRGTKHCVEEACRRGHEVLIVKVENDEVYLMTLNEQSIPL